MFQQLLAFYHPSTIYLVDDNKAFIENLSCHLTRSFKTKHNNNPLLAIEELNQNQELLSKQYLDKIYHNASSEEDNDTHSDIHYNLDGLNGLLFDKQIENTISVIIVDYSMPEMNGIEFCKQLSKHPAKKIMLTGEGDHQLAIDAFNANIIDGFIQKGESHYIEQLTEMVLQLQQAYFYQLQTPLIANITANLKSHHVFTEVLNTLNHFYDKNQIIKHIIVDTYGSTKMLNKQGKSFFFKIYTPEELNTYQSLVEGSDLSGMLEGKAPILLTKSDHLRPISSWLENLTPIHAFKENTELYYGCGELSYE